jgi:hypothetical protein
VSPSAPVSKHYLDEEDVVPTFDPTIGAGQAIGYFFEVHALTISLFSLVH